MVGFLFTLRLYGSIPGRSLLYYWLYGRWYSISIFLDENNIENLVTCTGNTETPTKQLLYGVEKDKVHSRKETLPKCKVQMAMILATILMNKWQ